MKALHGISTTPGIINPAQHWLLFPLSSNISSLFISLHLLHLSSSHCLQALTTVAVLNRCLFLPPTAFRIEATRDVTRTSFFRASLFSFSLSSATTISSTTLLSCSSLFWRVYFCLLLELGLFSRRVSDLFSLPPPEIPWDSPPLTPARRVWKLFIHYFILKLTPTANINNDRRTFTRTFSSTLRLSRVIVYFALSPPQKFLPSFSHVPTASSHCTLVYLVPFCVRLYNPLPSLKLQALTLYDEGFVYIFHDVKSLEFCFHISFPPRVECRTSSCYHSHQQKCVLVHNHFRQEVRSLSRKNLLFVRLLAKPDQ